jgi:hypothetical protein
MTRSTLPLLALLFGFTCLTNASAQSNEKKLEIGAQVTSLTLLPQSSDGYSVSEPGFGARLTYNLTDKLAAESELNLFPNRNSFGIVDQGRALQGQFGIKYGKRFKRVGLFAKVRPGFLSISRVSISEPGAPLVPSGLIPVTTRIARQTHFTIDIGGVVEFYPSRSTVFRVDAGDTLVRYGRPRFQPVAFDPQDLTTIPTRINHSFQLTAGFAFRFKDASAAGNLPTVKAHHDREVPRFEAGAQFTSISLQQPGFVCADLCTFGPPIPDNEPGLGGRFTYNLTSNIAIEAAVNFFPHPPNVTGGGGHLIQSQFGAKIGKRWERFGIFGKVRPGFAGFTDSLRLKQTQQVFVFGRLVEYGIFRKGWRAYANIDVGGVAEFYISRRLMTRLDIGDTIIHYGEYAVSGFSLTRLIVRRAPETHHNFQYSVGVGFRFK